MLGPSPLFRSLLPIVLLATTSSAGDLHVPGDFDDLQDAIDAAVAGDTILVHGGTFGPLVIDKPLQLLGDPPPLLIGGGPAFGQFAAPITLAGAGSGTVTLSNVTVGGKIHGVFFSHAKPGISGGGFAELHVVDSDVGGPEWEFLTGIGEGEPGIDTTVPFVLVERSTIHGSTSAGDPFTPIYGSAPPGPVGLKASGTVLLLDSIVRGGDAGPYTHTDVLCSGGCPPTGYGGIGLVAGELHRAASTIEGGEGATWVGFYFGFCCKKPDGAATQVALEVPLANDLTGSGKMQLGAFYTLTWSTPGPSATLFWSLGAGPPIAVPGLGFVYLDASSATVLGPAPAPFQFTTWLPNVPALAGLEVAFQLLDHTATLSRPLVGTLQL